MKGIKKLNRCTGGTVMRGINRFNKTAGKTMRRIANAAVMFLYYMLCSVQPTYAFGSGIQTLNNSLMDVIALAGVGIIIWGGWEMAKAMGERDSAGKVHALEIIIGGLIAIGIRTFVGLFGAG